MAELRNPAALAILWALIAQPAPAQQQLSPVLQPDATATDPPTETAQSPAEPRAAIVITGSRIPRPNLRSDSPIQTVRPRDFAVTGVPNVEETLNQMPQLVAGFTNTSNNPGHGAATLDLRGLGSVRTLVLVNGRRWIANDAGQSPEVDVNTIPSALVERVDIVTGGASAVYGSDAVTGVVNFVFRDKLDGLHVNATQNFTGRSDGVVSSGDLSFGGSAIGGRAKLIASAGWLRQDSVLQRDRLFSSITLSEACVVPGTRLANGASAPAFDPECRAPNQRGFVRGGSDIIPGTYLPAPFFLVGGDGSPVLKEDGVRFDRSGTAVPFVGETDLYDYGPSNYLQIGLRRWTANALPSFQISRVLKLYSELSYTRTDSPQQLAPVPAFLGFGYPAAPVALLNLDNPFLSPSSVQALDLNYGVDGNGNVGIMGSPETGFSINPDYLGDADGIVEVPGLLSRLEGAGPRRALNRRGARRLLAGAKGDISGSWHYDLFFSTSRARHTLRYENGGSINRFQQTILARREPASGEIVCIDRSNGCAPANVFGPGNLSEAAAAFIRTTPVDRTTVREKVAEASLRGEFPLTAAGPLGVVGGATWRRTSYAFRPDPLLFTGDELGFDPGTPASGSTRVWELFGEARVPLLADRRFAREITAELGARYSRYDTVGGVWTWKALGDWSPLGGVRVRGGLQRAVRAPNVRELYEEEALAFPFALDPCAAEAGVLNQPRVMEACLRNGVPAGASAFLPFESGNAFAFTRGNPNVRAEVARTLTVGAVVSPARIPGLTLTVDYYKVRIRNAISRLGDGSIWLVLGCIYGAGGDPAAAACQGYRRNPDLGYLEFIDQPTANIPQIGVSGIDWQLAYRRDLPWGLLGERDRAEINLAGTRYLHAGVRASEGLRELHCIGLFFSPCSFTVGSGGFPRTKLINQFGYTSGPLSLTLRHRWFSPTRDNRLSLVDQFGFGYYHVPAEGAVLEARHYFDLATTLRAGPGYELTFGINNLTNREPPITGLLATAANTDPGLYDVLGRRFFLTVTAKLFQHP